MISQRLFEKIKNTKKLSDHQIAFLDTILSNEKFTVHEIDCENITNPSTIGGVSPTKFKNKICVSYVRFGKYRNPEVTFFEYVDGASWTDGDKFVSELSDFLSVIDLNEFSR